MYSYNIQTTYIDLNVLIHAVVHVHIDDLGTETGRHATIHFVAGAHQLLGHRQVIVAAQSVHVTKCQRARQKTRQVLLQTSY